MRRRGALRSGNRAWSVAAVALTGCLLAVGLTACEATKISIAWDEGDSTTLTVPAGFKGELKINWNANGSCPDPMLEVAGPEGLITRELVGFEETSNGAGYFFVKGNNDGQYNSTIFQLECGSATGSSSNYLEVKLPGPVQILIVHPSGLDPLPQGMIQTRSIDGSYVSTETYKARTRGPFRPGFQYIGRAVGVPGQEVRVRFKPHPDGQFWTGTCPSSPATFVVRPGDQVDDSGYASPSCDFSAVGSLVQGWSNPVDEVMMRAVTPLEVKVSGPSDDTGLYGIRVGSADAGGFRPTTVACASTASTACTAKVVPGDAVTVGLKPPTDAGTALQGTCPSGATFQITSSSPTDVDGYATACLSFTPGDPTTDISVRKVQVRSFTVTGPADRLGLFGITIVSAPPGGSTVTQTMCTDTTKACTATFPAEGNVVAGFKPPSEGNLVGTCPGTTTAFSINAASSTDDSGYHFPCLSFAPTEESTTLSVAYVAPPPPPPSTWTVTVNGPCVVGYCDDTMRARSFEVKVGSTVCTNSAGACSATVDRGSQISVGIKPPAGYPGWNAFLGDCPGSSGFGVYVGSNPVDADGYYFPSCLTFTPVADATVTLRAS